MFLRPFTDTDAVKVLSFIQDETTFHRWSAGRYPHYPATVTDMLSLYATTPHLSAFTAEENGDIVGHITMRYTEPNTTSIRFGFILLSPDHRGSGLGKQMLRLAIEQAKRQYDAKEISLGVFEDNLPARYCYESVGFRNTGKVTLCPINDEGWRCLEYQLPI